MNDFLCWQDVGSSGPSATTSPPNSPAPGPRSRIQSAVADGLVIVLDDQHGVADVAQPDQGIQQAGVVAGMQADGGLVQHVQHAHQARADLGGQADALGFAAGEGLGRAVAGSDIPGRHRP